MQFDSKTFCKDSSLCTNIKLRLRILSSCIYHDTDITVSQFFIEPGAGCFCCPISDKSECMYTHLCQYHSKETAEERLENT